MTNADARKILGISLSVSLKSAEGVYLQKRNKLRLHMLQGNPRPVREQARSELTELTNAWNAIQTKQSASKRCPKPRRPASTRYPKSKRPATKPRPAKQVAALNPGMGMADYWDIITDMVPLPKPLILAILIIEFALVITILFLRTMKGA